MDKIDIVIPFVDSADPTWQKLYEEYSPHVNNEDVDGKVRFRSEGDAFKYVFRSIAKNMPWINNIYLLVQSSSQVPSWINTEEVKVVTHREFIPAEFLPTFNSCTIEMFLWKIPGLAEKFIYFNDDLFVTKRVMPNDYFSNEKTLFSLRYVYYDSIYVRQCRNSYELLFKDKARKDAALACRHAPRPYLRSEMQKCYLENKEAVDNSISRFRDNKNMNCYLFSIYMAIRNKQALSSITSGYLTSKSFDNEAAVAHAFNNHTVCINDTIPDIDIYSSPFVVEQFEKLFAEKSKYEN